jgi:hypothetical protein
MRRPRAAGPARAAGPSSASKIAVSRPTTSSRPRTASAAWQSVRFLGELQHRDHRQLRWRDPWRAAHRIRGTELLIGAPPAELVAHPDRQGSLRGTPSAQSGRSRSAPPARARAASTWHNPLRPGTRKDDRPPILCHTRLDGRVNLPTGSGPGQTPGPVTRTGTRLRNSSCSRSGSTARRPAQSWAEYGLRAEFAVEPRPLHRPSRRRAIRCRSGCSRGPS